jgi:hypothetical protein
VPRMWPRGPVCRARCRERRYEEPEHVPRQSATPDEMVCSQHGGYEWRTGLSVDSGDRLTNKTFTPAEQPRRSRTISLSSGHSEPSGGRNHCELVKGPPDKEPDRPDPRPWLDADEAVIAELVGDGASLLATPRRIVLVREGSEYRPRSGVRSWPYDGIVRVSLVRPRHGQARILLLTADHLRQPVSVFFALRHWPDAERLAAEIRSRLAGPSA